MSTASISESVGFCSNVECRPTLTSDLLRFTWIVDNFSPEDYHSPRGSSYDILDSPRVQTEDGQYEWSVRLAIHPPSDKPADEVCRQSVQTCLWLRKAPRSTVKVTCQIIFVQHAGRKKEDRSCQFFRLREFELGKRWGHRRFMPRETFFNPFYGFIRKNRITIDVSLDIIRPLDEGDTLAPSLPLADLEGQVEEDALGLSHEICGKAEEKDQLSASEALPGRTEHFVTIRDFIARHIEGLSGGCLLLDGVPGTGKTATVNQVIKHLSTQRAISFRVCRINGIQLSDPTLAYVRLAKMIKPAIIRIGADKAMIMINEHVRKWPKDETAIVVILDEMDMLATSKDQKIIYNFLDWSHRPNSRLIVVGIANPMDIRQRMQRARINSRTSFRQLIFEPYTKDDLVEVIGYHLQDAILTEDAMAVVCGQVAGRSGDARTALNIVRRAHGISAYRERKDGAGESGQEGIVIIQEEDVSAVCAELRTCPKIQYMQNASNLEKTLLQAIQDNGDGAELDPLIGRIRAIYIDAKEEPPTVSMCMEAVSRLRTLRLIRIAPAVALFSSRCDLECSRWDVQEALSAK